MITATNAVERDAANCEPTAYFYSHLERFFLAEDPVRPQTNASFAQPISLSAGRFALLLGILIFAVFPKVVLGVESFFFRDYGVLGYPFVHYHRECFWRGELPLWNPLSNCGTPFLAQWGTMTLYPLSLIYLVLPLPWSLGVFCLLHLFIGGLGMYFLVRRWTGNEFAAAFAAVAYIFNGTTFSCLIWPNYTVALGWMPWLVMLGQRAWREGGRMLVLAAAVGTLQMLSGVPELILLTWLVIGALFIVERLQQKNDFRSVLRLATVIVLVAGLSAIQILPFFDLLAHSHRSRDFGASKWAMPGWGWANLLVPLFHTFPSHYAVIFQREQSFMTSYYPGLAVLILASWAAWRVRKPEVWLIGLLVLFSYIMALGPNGYVFQWVKQALPVMGFARFPIKFVLLATFLLPVLGAFAIAHLQNEPPKTWRHGLWIGAAAAILLVAVILCFARRYPYDPFEPWTRVMQSGIVRLGFALAVLAGLAFLSRTDEPRRRVVLAVGILLLIVSDAATHTSRQNPTAPSSVFVDGLWQERHAGAAVKGRVAITPEAEEWLLRMSVSSPVHDFLGKRLALWSNLNLLDGIAKVNGSSTLQLREQRKVEQLLYPANGAATHTNWSAGLVDFLGVSHLTGSNVTEWIVRNSALPLITAGQEPVFECDENILHGITSENFDPRKHVYLPQSVRSYCTATNACNARITDIQPKTQRVDFTVNCQQPSLVLIAQSFYHPWRASVNGQPTPLWRANYAFQALQVPAGKHQVVLRYADSKLRIGAVISLISFLFGLFLWKRSGCGS